MAGVDRRTSLRLIDQTVAVGFRDEPHSAVILSTLFASLRFAALRPISKARAPSATSPAAARVARSRARQTRASTRPRRPAVCLAVFGP